MNNAYPPSSSPESPDPLARAGQSVQNLFADPGNEKLLAGIAHVSFFFLPIALPLVIWLACKDRLAYASSQGKQAFWFHLLYPLAFLGLFALVGVLALLVTLLAGVLGVLGTAASSGTGSPAPFLPFITIGGILGVLLILLFWLGAVALVIGGVVLAITGAVTAFDGRPFHYPFLGRI